MADQDTPSDAEEQGAWARPVSARVGEIVMAAALLAAGRLLRLAGGAPALRQRRPAGPRLLPVRARHRARPAGAGDPVLAVRAARTGEAVYLGHRDVLVVLAALAGVAFAFERADSYLVLGVVHGAAAAARCARLALAVVLGAASGWSRSGPSSGSRWAFGCRPASSGTLSASLTPPSSNGRLRRTCPPSTS